MRVPLLGVMAGSAVAEMNIASTALVNASRGLGMSADLLPIAAGALSIFCGATVVSSGLAADRLGRRRVLMFGLMLGILADIATALSATPWMYVIARCVVGVSIGIVYTASFATLRAVASSGGLGNALGIFGAVAGLTMLTESFIGGSLASVQWRVAFLVIPAVYVVALVLVPRVLPIEPPIGSGPIDLVGQVLLAVGIVGPLYAISQMTTALTQPRTIASFVIGLAAFAAFIVWERRTPHPFFPVRVLWSRIFLAGVMFGIGFNMSNATLVLQCANLWQYVRQMSTVQVALAQLPALAIGIVASIVAGRLMSGGWRERKLGTLGFLLVVVGFASLALYRQGSAFWVFVPGLLLVGAGAQAVNVPFGSLIIKSAPADAVGPVTSSRSAIGSVANALGMAGVTVVIDRLTVGGLVDRLTAAGVPPLDRGQALDAVTLYMRTEDVPTTTAARRALATAATSYSQAFSTAMWLMALLMTVLAIAAFLLLRPTRSV